MKTKKYLATLLDGSGHLNLVPQKFKEKSPDYLGFLKVENRIYRLAGWVKSTKAGAKSLALQAQETDEYGKPNSL